jgi:hypothetical protein
MADLGTTDCAVICFVTLNWPCFCSWFLQNITNNIQETHDIRTIFSKMIEDHGSKLAQKYIPSSRKSNSLYKSKQPMPLTPKQKPVKNTRPSMVKCFTQ